MRRRSIIPFVAVLPFSSVAFAQNWINPAGGIWGTPSNWSGDALPAAPTFDLGSTGYTVTLDNNYSVGTVAVETDTITLGLSGYRLTSPALNIATGASVVGSLTLLGPGEFYATNFATEGTGEVSGGQLIVNGATIYEQGLESGTGFSVNGLVVESAGFIDLTTPGNFSITNGTFNDGSLQTAQGSNLSLNQMMITNGSSISSDTISLGNATVDDSSVYANTSMSVTGAVTLQDHGSMAIPAANVSGTVSILPTAEFVSGDLTLTNTATISVEINSQVDDPTSRPITADDGTLDFTLENGFVPTIGEQFNIFDNTAPIHDATGTFASVNLPALPTGEFWDTSDLYTTGVISVVPEPMSLGILSIGLAGLGLRRRTRR